MPRIQATISIELWRTEQTVHDSLESSGCIGQAKGKNFELVVTKRSSECSLWLVLIPLEGFGETQMLHQDKRSTVHQTACQRDHQCVAVGSGS